MSQVRASAPPFSGFSSEAQPLIATKATEDLVPLPHCSSSSGVGVGWDMGIKIKMSQDQHLQINKL